jgi:hypothetical protein
LFHPCPSRQRSILWALAALAALSLACSVLSVNVESTAPTELPTIPPVPTLAPTLEVVVAPTDTSAPPPTAEPTLEPPTEPSANPLMFGELEIVPGRSFGDSADNFVVVGEVINHSADWQNFIVVGATYSDVDGNLLSTTDTYVSPLPLAPGETGVFTLYNKIDGGPAVVADIKLLITDSEVTDERPYAGLEVTVTDESTEELSNGTRYIIDGEVANSGDKDCASVAIDIGLYDKDGRLVYAAASYANDSGPVAAGDTAAWELATSDLEGPYDHYRVWFACFNT